MTAAQLVELRRTEWHELELLLSTLGRRRRRRAPPEALSRFAALFRNVCADLARARAQGFPDDMVDYLNTLAARCHNQFYVAPPFPLGRVWHFFRVVFPLAIRRNAIYVAVGLVLFYGPLAGMVALSRADDQVLYQFVPKPMLEQFEKMYEAGHAKGRSESTDLAMTGFYVKNNVGIAFQCFATGIFFGLGSLFFMLYNGIVIGAVVGFVSGTPAGMNLLSFIVGHGPWELTAICLSGAAGLRLGFGPLITGSRRRRDAMRLAAADAVRLVLGAAAMLLVAALVEGFFSPSSLPPAVKFGFGGLSTLFLVWYLGVYGWQQGRRHPEGQP
ncbi:MAG: stage II sporulation protein M [Deltaproteobacteria bacterium]|nr:stage II sporulation protein M [Deltaproteobacteria bacterium]